MEDTSTQTKYPLKYFESSVILIDGAFKSGNSFMPNYRPPPIRVCAKSKLIPMQELEIEGHMVSTFEKDRETPHKRFFDTEVQAKLEEPVQLIRKTPKSLKPVLTALPCIDFASQVHGKGKTQSFKSRSVRQSSTLRAYKRFQGKRVTKPLKNFTSSQKIRPITNQTTRPHSHHIQMYSKSYKNRFHHRHSSSNQFYDPYDIKSLVQEISTYNKAMLSDWEYLELRLLEQRNADSQRELQETEVLKFATKAIGKPVELRRTYTPFTKYKQVQTQRQTKLKLNDSNLVPRMNDSYGRFEVGIQANVGGRAPTPGGNISQLLNKTAK